MIFVMPHDLIKKIIIMCLLLDILHCDGLDTCTECTLPLAQCLLEIDNSSCATLHRREGMDGWTDRQTLTSYDIMPADR